MLGWSRQDHGLARMMTGLFINNWNNMNGNKFILQQRTFSGRVGCAGTFYNFFRFFFIKKLPPKREYRNKCPSAYSLVVIRLDHKDINVFNKNK
jgi:hypothetical protein